MKFVAAIVVSCLASGASALVLGRNSSAVHTLAAARSNSSAAAAKAGGFQEWYGAYTQGRGIWKWDQALVAYQRFMSRYTGQPVSLLEIGVQSGGSIDMYKAVLGAGCHYYCMDINPKCSSYQDATTTIAILDQGDAAQWTHFFTNVVGNVDVLVDDGGHQAFQMTTTMTSAFPHVNAGGVHLIEDIHGQNGDYLTGMFNPVATFLAGQGAAVASVHIYPFVLVVQKSGGTYAPPPKTAAAATFADIATMIAALPSHLGQVVELANPAWGSHHTGDALMNMFKTFYDLHQGAVTPVPAGCFSDAVKFPQCTMQVQNNHLQSLVSAVDIYPTYTQVHVAAAPPGIFASRKGTVWIPYGF
jgi:hypothetical protein